MGIVADNLRRLAAGEHPSAIAPDGPDERVGHLVTASHDTVGTLVVEVHDEGMGGERGLVFLGGIERQVAYQHIGQQRVGDDAVDDTVDGFQLVGGIDGIVVVGMLQRV